MERTIAEIDPEGAAEVAHLMRRIVSLTEEGQIEAALALLAEVKEMIAAIHGTVTPETRH